MTGATAMPSGTATLLFSDIEGSTRLEQRIGTGPYGVVRSRHRAILRAAFEANGGVEQGTEGDSFFVVFPTARSAIAAAVAAQRGLAAETWPDDAEVRVRMGLHSGEVETAGDSLVGLDINRAARIAAVAHGGQIVASEATRALAAASLPTDVSLVDLGPHRLKDLLRPERLVQVTAVGLPSTFPPLRSLDLRPNNLPIQLTSFLGRETELADVRRLLAATRLLTMTGPGGTGKTRLSLELAASVEASFADGVFFVQLEPIREAALVASTIAATLGLLDAGKRSARDALVDYLAGKRLLLVLDNVEQVMDAGPVVADLLRATDGVSIVVTSRAALHISGEQEYPVPGLSTPPDPTTSSLYDRPRLGADGGPIDLEALGTYTAVRLFIERALAVKPGFRVTNENAPAVAAICARLYGMPLAIELAAARIKLLSPEAILARLDHQLNLLAAGARDLPERQQTLRGAIAWSYDILDDGCRRLLDRLSIFRGGCDLDAAERVCGPAGELGTDVFDGLTSLVDQSLIRAEDTDGEVRFRLLDTIREYAFEMLEARAEAELIRVRHRDRFLDLAEEAVPALSGTDQRRWLERLELEHDNIRAVLDRAVALPEPEVAIRTGFAMWRFWQKRGHLQEARRRLEAMAATPWSRDDPRLRARLMEALGGTCWWQADLGPMAGYYLEAVDIWRALDDRRELANALYNASFIYAVAGTVSDEGREVDADGQGLATIQAALDLFREIGDERGEANAVWALGNYHYFQRQGGQGVEEFRQALDIFRRVGDRTMEAWSLHMLGSGLLHTSRFDEAEDAFRHAIRHFQDAGDAAGLTLLFDDMSALWVARGDLPRAARLRGAARSLTAETGAGLAGFVEDWFEGDLRRSVRATLDPAEVERYGAEGAAMSLEAAVAYALEQPAEVAAGPVAGPLPDPR